MELARKMIPAPPQRNQIEGTGCFEGLPTLSVAGDNLITYKDYTKLKIKHPFFVVAASDSSCAKCCESERILEELYYHT